jgi:alpha-tubulin suppressor-like RCC1 family protein
MPIARAFRFLLIWLVFASALPAAANVVNATWSTATDVPVSASSYTATGNTVNFTLNFAPPTGANLTVVSNTGLPFISGTFDNLAQGQAVSLSYGGVTYNYVAHYYGGTGNDLVLVWANSRLFDWGYGTATYSLVPFPVPGSTVLIGKTIVSVAAGFIHSLALCSDGTVVAWGDNNEGELGDNTIISRVVPATVNHISGISALFGKTVVAIAAGSAHSLALCSDGTVAAWGGNDSGQLGDNSNTNRMVPVAVNSTNGVSALFGKTVVAIAAGGEQSLALCSDGTLVAWGYNKSGQLGDNTQTQRNAPVAVNTDSGLSALFSKTVVAIAAGSFHTMALCSDGTVVAWGTNGGRLGNNNSTPTTVPVAVNTASGVSTLFGKTVVAIAAGESNSLALCSDGTMTAWGNYVGDNSGLIRLAPVAVNTASGVSALFGKTVTAITAGSQHGAVLCSDGTAAAWGYNGNGQLGDNTTTTRLAPVEMNNSSLASGERFSLVTSGGDASHTLALAAAPPAFPTVTTLGATTITATTAVLNGIVNPNSSDCIVSFDYGSTTAYGTHVAGMPSSVSGSNDSAVTFTLAGLSAGTTYHYRINAASAVGTSNGSDQTFATLGDVTATYDAATDVPLTTSSSYTATGCMMHFTLDFDPAPGTQLMVVMNNGLGFINGTFDNLAQGQTVMLSHGGNVYSFVVNYYGGNGNDLVLIWKNNRMFAWGYDIVGQLGDNTNNTTSTLPVPVDATGVLAAKTIISSAAGSNHSLALCSDGTVAAWGYNLSGQIGDGSNTTRPSPVVVSTANGVSSLYGKTVIAIAAGDDHSLALCSDGTVSAWGDNNDGELGNKDVYSQDVPVAVNVDSGFSALFGKTVVSVAAGANHSMALCSDGTVACWGGNSSGQLGDNSTTSRNGPVAVNTAPVISALFGKTVVAIAAGSNHSLALCSDGTVVAWGQNASGELGDYTTTGRLAPVTVNTSSVFSTLFGKTVVSIAAGDSHSVALCMDGTVATWGENNSGQLGDNSTTNSNVPVAVNTASGVSALFGKTVVDITASSGSCLVLCSDGSVASSGTTHEH